MALWIKGVRVESGMWYDLDFFGMGIGLVNLVGYFALVHKRDMMLGMLEMTS